MLHWNMFPFTVSVNTKYSNVEALYISFKTDFTNFKLTRINEGLTFSSAENVYL
jgi:hypothetical protein